METHRYFAFISYSRTDIKAATFIQSELEHFRYPKESIKPEYRPDDPTFVREVFLDKTGLSGQGESFEKKLDAALASSRYLIVLCSPEAAQAKDDPNVKHYVEWEIKTFLKHHGEDGQKRIIPIVLTGEPDMRADSCLPRPLRTEEYTRRNLPDMRPAKGQTTGFFGRKRNWHTAIVTLLSYIFDVERSIIFDRFTAERARTRLKIGMAAASAFVLCALIAAWGFFEQSRQRDTAAMKNLIEATYEFNAAPEGHVFRTSDLALSALSGAGRLAAAREYLFGQLLQRSWIVPIREDTHVTKYATCFRRPAAVPIRQIATPEGYPITYISTNDFEAVESGTGKVLWTKPAFGFTSGEVDPTGVTLVMARWHPEHGLQALDPFTGRELWQCKTGDLVRKVSFSPDGRRLAVLSQDGHVTIVNTRNGSVPFETYCAGPEVKDVAFSADGTELLLAKEGRILVCSILQTAVELPVRPLGAPLLAMDVSRDNTRLALLSNIRENNISLEVRDAKTLALLSRTEFQDNNPHIVAFSQDGRHVAVGGGEATEFTVFEIDGTNAPTRTFSTPVTKRLTHIVPVPDGFVACENSDGPQSEPSAPRLLLWQAKKSGELQDITPTGLLPLSLSRKGENLHVLTATAVVTLDAATRREIRRFPVSTRFKSIDSSDDGRFILSTQSKRQAVAFDRDGRPLFETTPYHEKGIMPTAISSDGKYCAAAVSPRGVQVFETDSGAPVTRVFTMPERIEGLKFDGERSGMRLFVFGGPEMIYLKPHAAYYVLIDPAKNRIVRLRDGLSDRISDIRTIENTAMILSGLNCSYAYFMPLENQPEEFSEEGFAAICHTLAGRITLENGVSVPKTVTWTHTDTSGCWEDFANEAERAPNQRHISFASTIPLSVALKTLEDGYLNEYALGLSLDPSHEPLIASYWIGFARKVLESRYAHQHPEMSKRDVDMHFASLSTEQWIHDIFNDPQTRFFCDAWTKRLLALYPESKQAQHQRDVFLSHTQLPKPKAFDVDAAKTAWRRFCAQSGEDALFNPIIHQAANAYSQDAASFSEFIGGLRELLIKDMTAGDLTYFKITSLVTLLGAEIDVWAHAVPNGDAINSKLLEDLIASAERCKPIAMAKLLESHLQLSLADSYLLQHDVSKAKACIAKALQSDDMMIKPMLPIYEAYFALAQGDGKTAAKRLDTFLENYKATYGAEAGDVLTRQIWLFLAYLKQSGLAFGEFSSTYDRMSRQYLTGIEIKVSPEGEAYKMGWRDGDRLIQLDGIDILDSRHLTTLLARRRMKDGKTAFVLTRGERTFTTSTSAPLLGFFY